MKGPGTTNYTLKEDRFGVVPLLDIKTYYKSYSN